MTQGAAPAFQFYPRDFRSLVANAGLSLEEAGGLVMLLPVLWIDGGIPADVQPARLARMIGCGCTPQRAARVLGALRGSVLVDNSGRLELPMLEAERYKQASVRESRKKAADVRWGKQPENTSGGENTEDARALHVGCFASASATALTDQQPTASASAAVEDDDRGTAAPPAVPPPAVPSAAESSRKTFEVALLVIRACNAGMSANPAVQHFTPIVESHGKSHQAVADWLGDGIPSDLILTTVGDAARTYQPSGRHRQVSTLGYFDARVRDAYDLARAATDAARLPPLNAAGGEPGSNGNGRRHADPPSEWFHLLKLAGDQLEWARRVEAAFCGAPDDVRERMNALESGIRNAWMRDQQFSGWSSRFQDAVVRSRVLAKFGESVNDRVPGKLPP